MKKFLQMIEVVKRQGDIVVFEASKPHENQRRYSSESFFHFAEHCNPIVFSPTSGDPVDLEGAVDMEKIDDQLKDLRKDPDGTEKYFTLLNAPFKIFSVEVLGDNNYVTVSRDEDQVEVNTACVMAVEQKPGKFIFFSLFTGFVMGKVLETVVISYDMGLIIGALLERLDRETIGVEATRERIKVGSGSDKRVITFRKIIHVRPKRAQVATSEITRRAIDWTHRFAVRGHWRKVDKLGKDRNGDYCVEGHTWVSEHIRGPEDAPLITKTRLVTDQSNVLAPAIPKNKELH